MLSVYTDNEFQNITLWQPGAKFEFAYKVILDYFCSIIYRAKSREIQ